MSFRRGTKAAREARKYKQARRCPKCRSQAVKIKVYPDEGIELRVCDNCHYPVRAKAL